MCEYKGYTITAHGEGVTVACGDEIWFPTIDEAIEFINEMEEE